MVRYGMLIDLNRCIGCNACTAACKVENATPPGIFYARVLEKEVGRYPLAKRLFLPVLCNHCGEPACLNVCPTGATYKREDGIVMIDQNKCIGCGSCIAACPYGARYMNDGERSYYTELTPFERHGYSKLQSGVVYKCTLCVDRVAEGLDPKCVQVCPTSCRYFGDLNDPNSTVSRLIRERNANQLLSEMGTDPSVYYAL